MTFHAKKMTNALIHWIRALFRKNSRGCNAVIGLSGGKDSSVCAALCVDALGKERVVGVLMPNGSQADISDSYHLVEHPAIKDRIDHLYRANRFKPETLTTFQSGLEELAWHMT